MTLWHRTFVSIGANKGVCEKTIKEICEEAKKLVPEPLWPDPDKEPLPPPMIHQIVKKPPNRSERTPITLFSIWTPN